jgi:hypothetical protein
MWQEFDPVESAVRRLLQQIGPQFSSTGAADWTDAERIAVARLLNAGLLEVEYRISIKQEKKHRAAIVLGRLSGGVCKPIQMLGEIVTTLGWYQPGVPLDTGVVAENMDVVQWRLTEQGERAVFDLARGIHFPVEWAMRDHPPCPRFFVVSMEPTPIEAAQATDATATGECGPVNVDVNSNIDLTLNLNLQAVANGDQKAELTAELPPEATEPHREAKLTPFVGGELVFFPDRVELCGVEICRGPRSGKRRRVLELLRQTRADGAYDAYSGAHIAEHLGLAGDTAVAGLVRDLRNQIVESLKNQANIDCQRDQVIKSGGPGYRFADCLSVQFVDPQDTSPITDMAGTDDVRNVRNEPSENVRDVRNGEAADVRDVRDENGVVRNYEAQQRRAWILQQLAQGVPLKAADVREQFDCSQKTAERDLTALRNEGRIEYEGTRRTGYYRLATE